MATNKIEKGNWIATASFVGSTRASNGTATKPNPNPANLKVMTLRISTVAMYNEVSNGFTTVEGGAV